MSHRPSIRPRATAAGIAMCIVALLALLVAPLFAPAPAEAHGFSSVVYVEASDSPESGVRAVLELEYDLLVVSVADFEDAPAFFDDGMAVFETGEEASALNAHADEIVAYVTKRFVVRAGGDACDPVQAGALSAAPRDGVPYAVLTLDFECASTAAPEFRSQLFPDSEQYVRDTVTILEYDIGGRAGMRRSPARRRSSARRSRHSSDSRGSSCSAPSICCSASITSCSCSP